MRLVFGCSAVPPARQKFERVAHLRRLFPAEPLSLKRPIAHCSVPIPCPEYLWVSGSGCSCCLYPGVGRSWWRRRRRGCRLRSPQMNLCSVGWRLFDRIYSAHRVDFHPASHWMFQTSRSVQQWALFPGFRFGRGPRFGHFEPAESHPATGQPCFQQAIPIRVKGQ